MRRWLPAVLLACALLGRGGVAVAEPPDVVPQALRDEVDKLLKDVASDRYEVREAARKRLQAVARAARPLLEARRDDPDAQVRLTVAGLLAALGGGEAAAPPIAALDRIGLVTLAAGGPLPEVLRALDAVVPGRVRLPPSAAQASVEAAADSRPYFEVLDGLLAAARVEVSDGFDAAGQAFATARLGSPAVAPCYLGPFRLDVNKIGTTRTLRPPSPARTVLWLRLLWSPEVDVVSYRKPALVAASDEAGKPFHAVDPDDKTVVVGPGRRAIPEDPERDQEMVLTLEPTDEGVRQRLASVEMRMRLRLRLGRREARIPLADPAKPALPVTLEVGGGAAGKPTRVRLDAFGRDAERPGWMTASVALLLPKGVPSEGVDGVLETTDGGLHPMYDLGSRIAASDGSLKLTLRTPVTASIGAPAALRVVWYEREEDREAAFVLKDLPLR